MSFYFNKIGRFSAVLCHFKVRIKIPDLSLPPCRRREGEGKWSLSWQKRGERTKKDDSKNPGPSSYIFPTPFYRRLLGRYLKTTGLVFLSPRIFASCILDTMTNNFCKVGYGKIKLHRYSLAWPMICRIGIHGSSTEPSFGLWVFMNTRS